MQLLLNWLQNIIKQARIGLNNFYRVLKQDMNVSFMYKLRKPIQVSFGNPNHHLKNKDKKMSKMIVFCFQNRASHASPESAIYRISSGTKINLFQQLSVIMAISMYVKKLSWFQFLKKRLHFQMLYPRPNPLSLMV